MHPDSLKLLESLITRLKSDHEGRLLSAGNIALEQFNPMRRATFGTSLKAYVQAAYEELSAYSLRVHEKVLSLTKQLLLPLSDDAETQVFTIAVHAFDEAFYPQRLQVQEEGMERKGERFGLKVNDWGIRTDIERALHHAGTSNLIHRALAALSDELELIKIQSSREAFASLTTPGAIPMPFANLMNDTVDLLKIDGTKVMGLKASVQRSKIFMDAGKLLVEPSDLLIRRMSNGAQETYRVIDPGFNEAFHGIKANYQMEVQKLGLPEAKSAVQSITYNITGNNARINQNAVDNSTNVVQIDTRVNQYIEALRNELHQVQLPANEKEVAMEIVDEVEAAFQSGSPKKSIVSVLLKSLPHISNVTAIVSSILSLL